MNLFLEFECRAMTTNVQSGVRLPIVKHIPIFLELNHIRDAFDHFEKLYLDVFDILIDPTILQCVLLIKLVSNAIADGSMLDKSAAFP